MIVMAYMNILISETLQCIDMASVRKKSLCGYIGNVTDINRSRILLGCCHVKISRGFYNGKSMTA